MLLERETLSHEAGEGKQPDRRPATILTNLEAHAVGSTARAIAENCGDDRHEKCYESEEDDHFKENQKHRANCKKRLLHNRKHQKKYGQNRRAPSYC